MTNHSRRPWLTPRDLLAWARRWAQHPTRIFWILDLKTLTWRIL